MMRPRSTAPITSQQQLPYDPAAIARQLKRTRQVLLVARKQADEALVERDDALDDVRKLKRELQDIKTGVKDEIHSLRADLNLISTERDVMRETLAAVHSASGTLAERLDDEASYGEFYDMFKWLWACSGPDLDRATVESQDSIKKNRLIEGLVKAVIEAQSVKADLCRERQICGELRQEAASLKAKLEGLKKSESDAQAQLVVKIEALRAAEVSCQQTKEGLESAERRGVWLTGQVREMQSLVNEKDALVQKLQREVSTAGEDARDLEESVLSQYLPRKLNPSGGIQRACTPEVNDDSTPNYDPSPPSSISKKGSGSRRVQLPEWGRKSNQSKHDCSDFNLRSLQITASID